MNKSPATASPQFVLWITGLSASGKTTIGSKIAARLREKIGATVFVDGDAFREVLGNDLGHSHEDRVKNAFRLARMCKFLSQQNVPVVCATMSLYPEIWAWNRENIPGYFQVYLKVPTAVLRERDPRSLYKRGEQGESSNIVGIDLPFNEPLDSDLIVDNSESGNESIAKAEEIIWNCIMEKIR